MVSSGKQIDAVRFIHVFQLTESYPLVPLLKTYLKDLRRNSQGDNTGDGTGVQVYFSQPQTRTISVKKNFSDDFLFCFCFNKMQDDVNAKELAALKAVIRCVQEFKLEADYPLDPLQKRVHQLERSKADKKRSNESKRQQQKKQKISGRWRGYRGPGVAATSAPAAARHGQPVFGDRAGYGGILERYAQRPLTYDYQVPSQPAYVPQANDQRLYYYPQDDRVKPAPYNATPSNYGGYAGSGMQSQRQPYMQPVVQNSRPMGRGRRTNASVYHFAFPAQHCILMCLADIFAARNLKEYFVLAAIPAGEKFVGVNFSS